MITESDCLIRDVGRRKQAMEMPIKNPEEIKSVGTEIGESPGYQVMKTMEKILLESIFLTAQIIQIPNRMKVERSEGP